MSAECNNGPELIEILSLCELEVEGEEPVLLRASDVNACEVCCFNFATADQLLQHASHCSGKPGRIGCDHHPYK